VGCGIGKTATPAAVPGGLGQAILMPDVLHNKRKNFLPWRGGYCKPYFCLNISFSGKDMKRRPKYQTMQVDMHKDVVLSD